MGHIYKISPEVVRFIIRQKEKSPDISCRTLALETSKRFNVKVSKSSVNKILIKESLSSPVGRKSKAILALKPELDYGGFALIRSIDYQLNISKITAEILIKLLPLTSQINLEETENIIQGLLIYQLINNTIADLSMCYKNSEIWAIVGRRPAKSAFTKVIKELSESQLIINELVREINQRLRLVSCFRFQLRDKSSFFIDARLQSIWQAPISIADNSITYYNAVSYVNRIINNEGEILSIFNIQELSIFSNEIINFIMSLDGSDRAKSLSEIDILDSKGDAFEKNMILGSDPSFKGVGRSIPSGLVPSFEGVGRTIPSGLVPSFEGVGRTIPPGLVKKFFLLGFWPWQFEGIYEWERKPAAQRLSWEEIGIAYYYQFEEAVIPQHIAEQDVKLTAIVLRDKPFGPVKICILTNIPKDLLNDKLLHQELLRWVNPEQKYADFRKNYVEVKNKFSSSQNILSSIISSINLIPKAKNEDSPERTENLEYLLEMLNQIIFSYFQGRFLPADCRFWEPAKIKEIFLRQKVTVKRTKKFLVYNFLFYNKLCKEAHLQYICQQINQLEVKDSQGRVVWFK